MYIISLYTKESKGIYYENKRRIKVGDIVEVRTIFYIGTVRCKITTVKSEWRESSCDGIPATPGTTWYEAGYVDKYYCQELESHLYFTNGWYMRDMIEM